MNWIQDPFPLHAVCGSLWKNTEGQISFLKHAVSAPPDKFTFAHSSRHLVILTTYALTLDKTMSNSNLTVVIYCRHFRTWQVLVKAIMLGSALTF